MNIPIRNWLLPVLAIAVLLLIIAWMAGSFRDRIEPGTIAPAGGSVSSPVEVQRRSVAISEPVPATVDARQATTVSSRILARITSIGVRAGDAVNQGQLLLELERSDLESRLAQAREQLRAARARMTEAEQNLERASQLHQQDLVSDSVLDEARARFEALSAETATARQSVSEAEIAISYTRIVSPIDGLVVERFAEPGDTASPGNRLLTLYNPLSLRIEAAVRENLSLPLTLGQVLEVQVPALQRTLEARIEERVPAADPGSRSFTIKAGIGVTEGLQPGMYARLMVPAGVEELILVPDEAITPWGQLDIVWVLENEQLSRRFVRTGRLLDDGHRVIVSGLEAGEQVVLRP